MDRWLAIHFQDGAAAIVSLVLALGVVVLAAIGTPIPPELATALGASIGWLFTRSGQVAGRQDSIIDRNSSP